MAIDQILGNRAVSQHPVDRLLRSFLLTAGVGVNDAAPPPIDTWRLLLPKLRSQRLMPAAYRVARQHDLPLPEDVRESLESAFFSTSLRYEQLRATLAEIATALSRKGLQAIVLKGMALADSAYPNPACRPMEDLDLLIRPEDHDAATEVLTSLGYSDRTFGVEDFRNPSTHLTVDLHTELLNTTEIAVRRKAWDPPLTEWWQRAIPLISHPSLLTFSSADHLEYLCHHAWLHHGLRKPLNLMDIALMYPQLHRQANPATGKPSCSNLAAGVPDVPPNPATPPESTSQSAIRNPQSESNQPSRAAWYVLAACRFHLGLRLSEQLLRGLRPARVYVLERLIRRAATRGFLPEFARHLYLWYALPRQERVQYLRQSLAVGRNALWPGPQRAEGYPKVHGQ